MLVRACVCVCGCLCVRVCVCVYERESYVGKESSNQTADSLLPARARNAEGKQQCCFNQSMPLLASSSSSSSLSASHFGEENNVRKLNGKEGWEREGAGGGRLENFRSTSCETERGKKIKRPHEHKTPRKRKREGASLI